MKPITLSVALPVADPDGIAAAQTTLAAGSLLINGALAAGGRVTLTEQQFIGISSTGNLSAITFTVAGYDKAGQVLSESLAGPNNDTVVTANAFAVVTGVTVSAAVGTNVTVGTTQSGASLPVIIDHYQNPVNVTLKLSVNGTADGTVQYTNDDVFSLSPEDVEWTDDTDLTNVNTGYETATIVSPITAVRLVNNSGSGELTLTVTQAGGAQS